MEVVGVGGAEAGDGFAGLGPGSCEFRMGMDDAANLGEFTVKQEVSFEIAGGVEFAFDDGAVEGGEDQVGGGHRGVGNAAGFDQHQWFGSRSVDAADVAEGVEGETAQGNFLIGPKHLGAKFWEMHVISLREEKPRGFSFLEDSSMPI